MNSIRLVEIFITTRDEEADKATKLEYSFSVDRVAVVAKGEAAKDV